MHNQQGFDSKKIVKTSKIIVDESNDFLYDISKINKDIFSKHKEKINNVAPLHHPDDVHSVLRKDIVMASLPASTSLQNAKKAQNNYFVCVNPIAHYDK